MEIAAENELKKNKLHVSWSDSTFFPWLNPTTVLDYFCDPRNPFYSAQCNNQLLKMQGMSCTNEQLSNMQGIEYQLYLSQPPLYVIRKVNRVPPKEVIPLGYYYILHGVVYQSPDLMSILSSRLQTSSFYLSECLGSAFQHYKYHPSKGYYWDFNSASDESSASDSSTEKLTMFQRQRVDLLITDFLTKFPPPNPQQTAEQQQKQTIAAAAANQQVPPQSQPTAGTGASQPLKQADQNVKSIENNGTAVPTDQPVEKKMKLNSK